ncbi:cytochrome P450 [Actinokineospora sp. HUAS TT18]|uniref:cytochrome P450 n=1 Tax=Actinokineospora sp. HUAS TT18 TaxID=3447451 RepID=UPI003F51B0D1
MAADRDGTEYLDPASPKFIHDPYSAYAEVRRSAPVAQASDGQWILLGDDEISAALRDVDRFTSTRNLDGDYPLSKEVAELLNSSEYYSQGMFNADPPDHSRMRKLLAEFFSPRNVRTLEPAIRAITDSLVDGFAAEHATDLISCLAYPLPLSVICLIMGVPPEDQDTVKEWSQDWTALLVLPLDDDAQVRCASSLLAYDNYLRSLLANRFANPRNDVATVLAGASMGTNPTCSVAEAVVVLRSLLLAGHETASGLIGNTLYHLLRTSEWSRVVAEPRLIPAAIDEGLRFDPSSQSTIRVTTVDVIMGGVVIPAGSRVHPMTGSVGRDENQIPDANVFRLDRGSATRHLAFGVGIHYCLGAALTRVEMAAALSVLVSRLPGLRLADGFEAEFVPGGFSFRSLMSLPVEWD